MTGGSPVKRMTPPTVNTQVRGPFASMQARSEPGPESFRLLTLMTAPPRPPCALRPKPSAPGQASGAAVAGGVQDGRTAAKAIRSEERRVGKEGGSTVSYGW